MARYHLTDNGPMKCSAQIECPLQRKAIENGEDPDKILHYDRKALAEEAYAEKLAHKHEDSTHTGLKKSHSTGLGLTVEDVSKSIPKEFRNGRLYSNERISGHIDVDQLNEDSYKQFGFEKRTGKQLVKLIESNNLDTMRKIDEHGNYVYYSDKVSRSEMEQLSTIQKNVLNCYSGNIYKDVTKSISEKGYYDDLRKKFPKISQEGVNIFGFPNKFAYPREEQLFKSYEYTEDEKQYAVLNNGKIRYYHPQVEQLSKPVIDKMIGITDEALQKGPKRQRVVWRGAQYEKVAEWMGKERSVGTVIEFDGYQSGSYSPYISSVHFGVSSNTSREFPSSLLYEIRTPEGLAISSESIHPYEEEVLLPRGQRYVIVGNYTTEPVDDEDYGEITYTVVQMVAVDKDNNILDGTNSNPPKTWRT